MNTQRFLVALTFALVCSGLLTWQIGRRMPHAPKAEHGLPRRQLVVASKDVYAGDVLSGASAATVSLPMAEPLPGSFQSLSEVNGQVLQVPIRSGEPILTHDLAPTGSGIGMAVVIPKGMRAVSLRAVDQSTGGTGYITPGSFVDVLVTCRPGSEGAYVSSMVLQATRVLAVGSSMDAGGETKSHPEDGITLLVTPDEAERLAAANMTGKISLALRNGTDRVVQTEADPIMRKQIAGKGHTLRASAQMPAKATANTSFTVETLSGGKATTQTFSGEQH